MAKSLFLCAFLVGALLMGSGCGKKRDAEAAFANAEWLESAGRFREAISHYETVAKLDPGGAIGRSARMKMAEISFKRLKDYDSAKSMYGMMANLYPDTEQAREAKKKIEEIGKILKIKAEAIEAGDSLSEQGKFGDALERYSVAQSLAPGDPVVEERIESVQGSYDEQRKREAFAALARGDVYLAQDKPEEAIREYLIARDLTPEDEELWDKVDLLSAKIAPLVRERSFEEALKGATALDVSKPGAASSLAEGQPAGGEQGEPAAPTRQSGGRDIYVSTFSILLPDYNHYFQGYKLQWVPGAQWSMVTCSPPRCSFPFLEIPMRDVTGFEALCAAGADAGTRPSLKGLALLRIVGENEAGALSAEIVDARLEIPGRGFLYILREKKVGPSARTATR